MPEESFAVRWSDFIARKQAIEDDLFAIVNGREFNSNDPLTYLDKKVRTFNFTFELPASADVRSTRVTPLIKGPAVLTNIRAVSINAQFTQHSGIEFGLVDRPLIETAVPRLRTRPWERLIASDTVESMTPAGGTEPTAMIPAGVQTGAGWAEAGEWGRLRIPIRKTTHFHITVSAIKGNFAGTQTWSVFFAVVEGMTEEALYG